jgi:hypothetical protein
MKNGVRVPTGRMVQVLNEHDDSETTSAPPPKQTFDHLIVDFEREIVIAPDVEKLVHISVIAEEEAFPQADFPRVCIDPQRLRSSLRPHFYFWRFVADCGRHESESEHVNYCMLVMKDVAGGVASHYGGGYEKIIGKTIVVSWA